MDIKVGSFYKDNNGWYVFIRAIEENKIIGITYNTKDKSSCWLGFYEIKDGVCTLSNTIGTEVEHSYDLVKEVKYGKAPKAIQCLRDIAIKPGNADKQIAA